MAKRSAGILLIDDDPDWCRKIEQRATERGFEISYFSNLDDGIAFLESNQKVRMVILDSRCALDGEQRPDSFKTNFVFHAMDQINRVEYQQNRHIPFVVFSDELFDLEKDLEGLAKVISKKEGDAPLWDHIERIIETLPEMAIREKYQKVFSFIGDFMSEEDDDLMESLLMNMERSDPHSVVTNLSVTRRLLEKLFDTVAPNRLGKPAGAFERKGMSRTRSIMSTLASARFLSHELQRTAGNLYTFTSKYGNHNKLDGRDTYAPGVHAALSSAFALLELFCWASDDLNSISR